MQNLEQLERTAVEVIRNAGRYEHYLRHFGLEAAGVADWLECQVPKVRRVISAVARTAASELNNAFKGNKS